MLHTSAVEPGTLSVLKRLMQMPALDQFSLVGGTALALRFGHRTSIDIDLFRADSINQQEIENALADEFGGDFVFEKTKITFAVFCRIQDVKIDIVRYPHQLVAPWETVDGI